MKLSQLDAECSARLAELRHRAQDPNADAECFVSFISRSQIVGAADERDVEGVELFLRTVDPCRWVLEIKTEKDT